MKLNQTYQITLIGILSALAVAGRMVFAFLPNVQPATVLIIIAAVRLGLIPALSLSVVTVLVSNLFLGMGFWSIGQMISWGLIAVLSTLFGRLLIRHPIKLLVPYAVICGYVYGFLISLQTYQVTGSFWPYYFAGLPFDTYHALGNGVFAFLLFAPLSKLMTNYPKHAKK